ncbi:hypothetical protein Tco_0573841 [Tanacetum coccineum]
MGQSRRAARVVVGYQSWEGGLRFSRSWAWGVGAYEVLGSALGMVVLLGLVVSSGGLTISIQMSNPLAVAALHKAWSSVVQLTSVVNFHRGHLPTSTCCYHSLLPFLPDVQPGSLM